jgi:hypothetical protein
MSHKALVFLSCGQRDGERELARCIQQKIKELGFDCYNADSWQGFDDVMSITEYLSKADYYLFIDFKREGGIPISVFAHQEFALARAWGITEMLAFREKGLSCHTTGMVSYVLAHPIEFDRENLVALVKKKIEEKGWKPEYSRNLVASRLERTAPVCYTDHHGTNCEKIWQVVIENKRSDRAALNTIAILDKIEGEGITEEEPLRPDTTFLKWAEQRQTYQRTILPGCSARVDAFALRVNEDGVFLHSDRDVYPREPVISSPGKYILTYLLYADSFPPVRFKVKVVYKGQDKCEACLLR